MNQNDQEALVAARARFLQNSKAVARCALHYLPSELSNLYTTSAHQATGEIVVTEEAMVFLRGIILRPDFIEADQKEDTKKLCTVIIKAIQAIAGVLTPSCMVSAATATTVPKPAAPINVSVPKTPDAELAANCAYFFTDFGKCVLESCPQIKESALTTKQLVKNIMDWLRVPGNKQAGYPQNVDAEVSNNITNVLTNNNSAYQKTRNLLRAYFDQMIELKKSSPVLDREGGGGIYNAAKPLPDLKS